MKIQVNGRIHEGEPIDIVREMKSYAFGGDSIELSDFVNSTAQATLENIESVMNATDSHEVACTALLNAMIAEGVANLLDEG